MNEVYLSVVIIGITIMVCTTISLVVGEIMETKRNKMHALSTASFEDLVQVLNNIINLEIAIYENNVFSTKGALNNSSFENYYNEITTNIINDVNKPLLNQLSLYMTEEAVITMICRLVRQYLTDKIK